MKNFTEYWNARKSVLEKLGVTEDVAKMIWDTACDTVMNVLIEQHLLK